VKVLTSIYALESIGYTKKPGRLAGALLAMLKPGGNLLIRSPGRWIIVA